MAFICCGVRIDPLTPNEAVEALTHSKYGESRRTHLCNAYTLSLAMRDKSYLTLLNASDINFADGHYVAMAGRRIWGANISERVYGPTLMTNTMDSGRERGLRHYLYGAAPRTVELLAEALRHRLPGVEIVGVESPPFRPLTPEEEQDLFDRVRLAQPDVFWVGLGTPRQDEFVARYSEELACTVVPVGAAFDFHAGTKRSAPEIVQKHGMEWFYRLLTEPTRLWRRYLIGIPIFLLGVLADRRRRQLLSEAK